MSRLLIFLLLISFSCSLNEKRLEPKNQIPIKGELSAITFCKNYHEYVIVADGGILIFLDTNFKELRRDKIKVKDLEGAICLEDEVLVVDEEESILATYKMDKEKAKRKHFIELTKTKSKKNGYEGITYDSIKNQFILIVEDGPARIRYFDSNFNFLSEEKFIWANDLSDVLWYQEKLLLLSDLDERIFVVNDDLKVKYEWLLPIKNPEGLCVVNNHLVVVSDKEEKLYIFDFPEDKF